VNEAETIAQFSEHRACCRRWPPEYLTDILNESGKDGSELLYRCIGIKNAEEPELLAGRRVAGGGVAVEPLHEIEGIEVRRFRHATN
jgi:hypothetical protein